MNSAAARGSMSRDMPHLIPRWSSVAKPVVGMVHLLPLPGSPKYGGRIDGVRDAALRDAEALAEGGAHGLMLENFGDVPFHARAVPPHVVAHMTMIAGEIARRVPQLPLGINVLRNDGRAALAIAQAVGASFIRVNVLCGARVTDQGIVGGIAHDLLRDRAFLGAQDVKIFADVDVKHSAPLGAPRPIAEEVSDTIDRGLADAIIVTGAGTGQPTAAAHAQEARRAARAVPVFIGSGVSAETIASLIPHADGFIIGTSLKRDGIATNPVDVSRVRAIVRVIQ
jgi:membrane complex biogenesis BtpA family protein